MCRAAGHDRFAIYDVENTAGTPVYVHAKVVVIDDVWAMIGSDNLNRRSWTHDSELSCAVLDAEHDPGPTMPGRSRRPRPGLRRPPAPPVARAVIDSLDSGRLLWESKESREVQLYFIVYISLLISIAEYTSEVYSTLQYKYLLYLLQTLTTKYTVLLVSLLSLYNNILYTSS